MGIKGIVQLCAGARALEPSIHGRRCTFSLHVFLRGSSLAVIYRSEKLVTRGNRDSFRRRLGKNRESIRGANSKDDNDKRRRWK